MHKLLARWSLPKGHTLWSNSCSEDAVQLMLVNGALGSKHLMFLTFFALIYPYFSGRWAAITFWTSRFFKYAPTTTTLGHCIPFGSALHIFLRRNQLEIFELTWHTWSLTLPFLCCAWFLLLKTFFSVHLGPMLPISRVSEAIHWCVRCFCMLMLVMMLGEALAMSGRDPASSDKSCVEQNHRAVSHAKNRTSQTADCDNMFVWLCIIGDSIP